MTLKNCYGIMRSLEKSLIFLLLCLYTPLFAQSGHILKADSLYICDQIDAAETLYIQALDQNPTAQDSCKALRGLGRCAFYKGLPDTAYKYYHQAYHKAKINNYTNIFIDIGYNLGTWHLNKGERDSCTYYLEQGQKLAQKSNFIPGKMWGHYIEGRFFESGGLHNKATQAYEKCNELARQQADTLYLAKSLHGIGRIYFRTSVFDKALASYQQAAELFDKLYIPRSQGSCLLNMGQIWIRQADWDRAHSFLIKARDIFNNIQHKKSLANVWINLGIVYAEQDLSQKSLEAMKLAADLYHELGERAREAGCLTNMGLLSFKENQLDQALTYLKKSLQIKKEIGDQVGIAIAQGSIGDVLLQKNKYNDAIEMYKHAEKQAKTLQLEDYLSEVRHNMAKAYAKTGYYQKAYLYEKEYAALQDSLYSKNLAEQLADMETRYQTRQKEQEINHLEAEKKLQSTIIQRQRLLIIFLVLFTGIAITAFILQRRLIASRTQLARKNKQLVTQESHVQSDEKIDTILKNFENLLYSNDYYLQENLTLNQCATELGINRSYLSEAINRGYGKSFSQLINEWRIKHALRLLVAPEFAHFSIEGIGRQTGYSNRTSFITAFKTYTGITPAFYRNTLKEKV